MFSLDDLRHWSRLLVGTGTAVAVAFAASCEQHAAAPHAEQAEPAQTKVLSLSADTASILRTLSPLPRIPEDPTNRHADDPAAAHFGQFLFFDTALSGSGNLSCSTCHQPQRAFTDGLTVAIASETGIRNTPSIINVAHYPWLNWDGSADSTWSQALGPFEADHELASTRTSLAKLIGTDPHRRAAYEAIFGPMPEPNFFQQLPERARPVPSEPDHPDAIAWRGLTDRDRQQIDLIFVNLGKAIGAYQRNLIAANSPFDRFAATVHERTPGEWIATASPDFDASHVRGLELFTGDAGCIACHAGPLFTDFTFHSVRVAPIDGGPSVDPGRYEGLRSLLSNPFNSAGNYSDGRDSAHAERLGFMRVDSESWGLFRTPSLRNVALTAPYMHAGQFEDLNRVIRHYSTFEGALPPDHHAVQSQILRQLNLNDEEIADLIAFLESLTDINIRFELLEQPKSPFMATP